MAMDVISEIERYRGLLEIAEAAKDTSFYNAEKVKFNNYNKMFSRFDRDMLK